MARTSQRDGAQRADQRSSLALPPDFVLHEETGDRFHIPAEDIPDGVSYEWKRLTYMGKVDTRHQSNLAQNRWAPVPLSRHPEYGSDGGSKEMGETGRFGKQEHLYSDCIIRDGQILMERPLAITQYVNAHEKRKADDQVRDQLKRVAMAPEGTLAGVDRQRTVRASRSRDLSIPEDAE